MRVISLVPSITETLRAWGADPVACTRFCEQPDLPLVGGTKSPDIGRILSLRPDLVVLDEEENRLEDAIVLERAGIVTHVTAIRSLADVAPAMHTLAAAVGAPASEVVDDLPPPLPGPAVRAFVPIWRRPWMTINDDTYGASLLAHVGVVNVFGGHADRYPTIELDEARALAPDVVLAPSEPYAFGRKHVDELESVAPTVLVDGKDLFWWGTRTAGAVRRLSAFVAEHT